ncbi:hypothetical protein [Streptomyces sp. SAS_270]|uniref:hypothetical protein n=1 Tax=Streptomyces sp. SAS_270 TaxID=3412748 RepID=UPI00403CBEA5
MRHAARHGRGTRHGTGAARGTARARHAARHGRGTRHAARSTQHAARSTARGAARGAGPPTAVLPFFTHAEIASTPATAQPARAPSPGHLRGTAEA